MPYYRVYTIGPDGRFIGAAELEDCDNDEAAIERARQLLDGHDLDIWQRDRFVRRLSHKNDRGR